MGVKGSINCLVFPLDNSAAWPGSLTGIGAPGPGDGADAGPGYVKKTTCGLTVFSTGQGYKNGKAQRALGSGQQQAELLLCGDVSHSCHPALLWKMGF